MTVAVHPEYPKWLGTLAMSLAMNSKRVEDKHVREDMERPVRAFLASGVPGADLRGMLEKEIR